MFDVDEKTGSNSRRILWISLCGLGIIMILGAIAGFLSAHIAEGGGPLNIAGYAVLAAPMSVTLALAFVIWKLFHQMKRNGEKVPRREKLNRNIIMACTGLGVVIGLATGFGISNTSGNAADPFAALLTSPIPLTVVIPLVVFWGVIMPVVAWFWHTRAIDEQEESAYRDGGYYAAYAFLFLTPLWWLLWRGGLLPEPNIVAIYCVFSLALLWHFLIIDEFSAMRA